MVWQSVGLGSVGCPGRGGSPYWQRRKRRSWSATVCCCRWIPLVAIAVPNLIADNCNIFSGIAQESD